MKTCEICGRVMLNKPKEKLQVLPNEEPLYFCEECLPTNPLTQTNL